MRGIGRQCQLNGPCRETRGVACLQRVFQRFIGYHLTPVGLYNTGFVFSIREISGADTRRRIFAMPIYEYKCDACNHIFETLQKISESPLIECPVCGKATLQETGFLAGLPAQGRRLV